MDSLSFSHNWNNKLYGKYYTTLRLASSKYRVGNQLTVQLQKSHLHTVTIMQVCYLRFDQLNDFIIGLDMGLTLLEGKAILQKMYHNIDFTQTRLVLVLCKVVTAEKENDKLPDTTHHNITSQS